MDKKVLISVKTIQYMNGEPETIELITQGKYYKEGSDYMAEYDETEISGMEGTRTTLRIENDALTIERKGTTTSNLKFKEGLDHVSMYTTPFGTLEVMIKPKRVEIAVDEEGGKVQLEYKMEAVGLESIDNSLQLSIKSLN